MDTFVAAAVLLALLLGPLLLASLEHNLEPFCFTLGLFAVTATRQWEPHLVKRAMLDPLPITVVVIAAGILFGRFRTMLDRGFNQMRRMMPRPLLTALIVLVLGVLSCVFTAIVAALMLAEAVGLMGLGPAERIRVVVLGCFSIGLGSALTPIGGPLATLAASAMGLDFSGLFRLLAPWVLPGIVAISCLAAILTRGPYDLADGVDFVRPRAIDALAQGLKIFAFISGLIMVGAICSPVANSYLVHLPDSALYWANTVSAALDNATLVAVEFHEIEPLRARTALISLLVSGGMLIPGNVPNIVCAGKLGIRTAEWARIGLPLGFLMLLIYLGAIAWL